MVVRVTMVLMELVTLLKNVRTEVEVVVDLVGEDTEFVAHVRQIQGFLMTGAHSKVQIQAPKSTAYYISPIEIGLL